MTKEEFLERWCKAAAILNSVELQNKIHDSMPYIPKELLPNFMKKRYAMGEVDEWPNATGEFGRTQTNPILVNETRGEITYLSRLSTTDNQRMIFHRLGSVSGAIDKFELVSVDGKFFDVLYLDMHHRHCSKKAPTGYTLLEFVDGITGTSEYNPDFPDRVEETLAKTACVKFGAPIVSPEVLEFNAAQAAKLINEVRRDNELGGEILGRQTI